MSDEPYVPSDFLASGGLESTIRRMGGDLIGKRIGVYELTALLGAGGMGEVYRARDTRLERDVAVKVLPVAFAAHPDRLSRFDREARLLASLNHPHIGAIYGFEHTDDLRALVLELVEGETLADRLAKGALSVEEALHVALRVAEALEAAHEKGIIHRDLKPSNIKVTHDNDIKVLDFGLAKLIQAPGSELRSSDASEPAMAVGGTRSGTILGTPAYMSPEQARGQALDKRTDIWAFGCLLYEMLTGRTPFGGETTSDTIAAIIGREPDWRALPQSTPAGVRRLLSRCLKKDPKERLRDIGDAIIELREPLIPAGEVDQRSRYALSRFAAVMAAFLSLAALLGWVASRSDPPSRPVVTRLTYTLAEGQRLTTTWRSIAMSHAGDQIAYVANQQLFLKRMAETDAVQLTNAEAPQNISSPAFSPDGRSVAFFSAARAALQTIVTSQGSPMTVGHIDSTVVGISWDEDGILYSEAGKGILRVSSNGGTPELLVRVEGNERAYEPQALPGGRILYTLAPVPDYRMDDQVVVQTPGSTNRQTIIRGGSDARYLPTGHIVYVAGMDLFAVRFDPRRAEVQGTAVRILGGITRFELGAAQFSVSNSGALIYLGGPAAAGNAYGESILWTLPGYDPQRTLVWVDRQGREESIPAPPRAYLYPRLSPDGTRAAIDVREMIRDSAQNIAVWDFARETLSPLILDAKYPAWTHDGKHIVFASGRRNGGTGNLYRQAADGSGEAERLTEGRNDQSPHSFSPDGSTLIFRQVSGRDALGAGPFDLLMLDLASSRRATPLLTTKNSENNGELSPDGRWLAYESDESGDTEVYLRPFPNVDGGRVQVSAGGGTRPLWARNGRELFYLTGRTPNPIGLMSVNVQSGSTITLSKPERLFQGPYLGYSANVTGRTYDVSPDGRFLLIKNDGGRTSPAPRSSIFVVLNWFDELKQKVPAN